MALSAVYNATLRAAGVHEASVRWNMSSPDLVSRLGRRDEQGTHVRSAQNAATNGRRLADFDISVGACNRHGASRCGLRGISRLSLRGGSVPTLESGL